MTIIKVTRLMRNIIDVDSLCSDNSLPTTTTSLKGWESVNTCEFKGKYTREAKALLVVFRILSLF